MSLLERYCLWYEHEKDCNSKMLAMLDSVPASGRTDARFQQAVTLADHLAACREKWLSYMQGNGPTPTAWWNAQSEFALLRPRFIALENQWTTFLAQLDTDRMTQDFEFAEADGAVYRLPVEAQIVQLFGHAAYHRGQIALLVDQLGGETIDTDYIDWWWANLKEK